MKPVSILIVDDNFVARRGLRSFLTTHDNIHIAGEAVNGREAIAWVQEHDVDLVLMDVRMPDTDGIKATAEITRINPEIKVIMLTVVEDQAVLVQALLAGARGYLVYGRFTPDDLVIAIRKVQAGGSALEPEVSPALLDHIRSHAEEISGTSDMEKMEPLTSREKEILGLIATGKGNRDIADVLGIEEKTVKNHINNIYSKLQIKSRYQAIAYMLQSGSAGNSTPE